MAYDTPSWLHPATDYVNNYQSPGSGAEGSLQGGSDLASKYGNNYFDSGTNTLYAPSFNTSGGTDSQEPASTLSGWRSYSAVPGAKGAESYNGQSYTDYDASGKQTGSGIFEGLGGNGFYDWLPFAMLAIPAALTAAGVAGAAGAGAAGAGTTTGATAGTGASAGATGATSGLGSGLADLGLGSIADAGIVGSPLTAAPGAASAWLPGTTALGGGAVAGTVGNVGLGLGAPAGLWGPGALTAGGAAGLGGAAGAASAGAGAGSAVPSASQTMSGASAISKLLGGDGGSGSGSSGGLADILRLLGGASDYNRQNDSADKMLEWLKSRTAITDNLYQPGTPEYNRLWDEMSRKDAAAGRNSQYGPRSVDLAARISQIKSAENTKMTTGIGQWMNGAYDQKANSLGGLLAGLGSIGGGNGLVNAGGSLLDLISRYTGNGSSLNLEDTVDENSFQPGDGDYGQYF
jgi:hypothetical protein